MRPSLQAQQIAAGAVDRFDNAVERGQSEFRVCREFRANPRRKGGNLDQVRDLLVINRAVDLFRAVGGLARRKNLPQLAKFHPYKSLRH